MIDKHIRFCELCDEELADIGRLCNSCHKVLWDMAKEDKRKREWKTFCKVMVFAFVAGLIILAWQIQTGY